jgi:three-Cys-motif partner protein
MSLYHCDTKHFRYGDKVDEIHPFFENKREWSKIKDRIVGSYVTCYLHTVQRLQKSIIIVDSFSGPGRFGDRSDGSPLIICKSIEKTQQKGSGIGCIFSDAHPAHREALEIHLGPYISKGIAEKPLTDFSQSLSKALSSGHGATLFFYLDPYGIRDLEFDIVKQIYERDTSDSTEVLINFNFKAFMRMSGNWNYTDAATDIARKVKESKIERVNSVMGGNYWNDIITDPTVDKLRREDLVVDAYKEQIRNYFRYTYSIPVKELEESSSVPTDQIAKYHLIFGTRHVRAVQYMNDVCRISDCSDQIGDVFFMMP